MVEVNFECVFKRKFELFVMCYTSKVGWIMPNIMKNCVHRKLIILQLEL
jgi:hypothetical protein